MIGVKTGEANGTICSSSISSLLIVKSRLTKTLIQIAFGIAIVYILIGVIASGWAEVLPQFRHIQWPNTLYAMLIANVFWFFTAILWWMLLRKLGSTLNFSRALIIWTYSQAVRHLPGRIWNILGRIYLSEKEGATRVQAITSTYYEMIITITGGFLVSLLIFLHGTPFISRFASGATTVIVTVVLLIMLYPPLLVKVANFILLRLKRDKIKIEMSFQSVLVLVVYSVLNWWVIGIAVYLLTRSLTPVDISNLPFITASFAAAWIIGHLSVFTHQGLGIREYILAYCLGHLMPFPLATFIALLTRISFTIAEVLFIIFILGFAKYFDHWKQHHRTYLRNSTLRK